MTIRGPERFQVSHGFSYDASIVSVERGHERFRFAFSFWVKYLVVDRLKTSWFL